MVAKGEVIGTSEENIRKPLSINVLKDPETAGTNNKFTHYTVDEQGRYVKAELTRGKDKVPTEKDYQRQGKYPMIPLNSAETNFRREMLLKLLNSEKVREDLKILIDQMGKSPKYKDMCSKLAAYFNETKPELLKEYSDLEKFVLNFGMDKNGNVYVGINDVEVPDIALVKQSLGSQQNVYQGCCAETSLRAAAGENLRGCYVYDLHIKYDKKNKSWEVEPYPPCNTCFEAVNRYSWLHPVYDKH